MSHVQGNVKLIPQYKCSCEPLQLFFILALTTDKGQFLLWHPIARTCLEGGICSRIHVGGIGRSSRCIAHWEASCNKEHSTVISYTDLTLKVLTAQVFTETSKQPSITPPQIKHCHPLLPSFLKMNAEQREQLWFHKSSLSYIPLPAISFGKQSFV